MLSRFWLFALLLLTSKYGYGANTVIVKPQGNKDNSLSGQNDRKKATYELASFIIKSIINKKLLEFEEIKIDNHLQKLLGERPNFSSPTLRELFEKDSALKVFSMYFKNDLIGELFNVTKEILKRDGQLNILEFLENMPYIDHEHFEAGEKFLTFLFDWFYHGIANLDQCGEIFKQSNNWTIFIKYYRKNPLVKKFDFLVAYAIPSASIFDISDERSGPKFITVKDSFLKLILKISVIFFNIKEANMNLDSTELKMLIIRAKLDECFKEHANMLVRDRVNNFFETPFRLALRIAMFMRYLSGGCELQIEFLELLKFPLLEKYLSSGFDKVLRRAGEMYFDFHPHKIFSICKTADGTRASQLLDHPFFNTYPVFEGPAKHSLNALTPEHRNQIINKMKEQNSNRPNNLSKLFKSSQLVLAYPTISFHCEHFPNIQDFASVLEKIHKSILTENGKVSIIKDYQPKVFGFILRRVVTTDPIFFFQVHALPTSPETDDLIFLFPIESLHNEILQHFNAITYKYARQDHKAYFFCLLEDFKGFGFTIKLRVTK